MVMGLSPFFAWYWRDGNGLRGGQADEKGVHAKAQTNLEGIEPVVVLEKEGRGGDVGDSMQRYSRHRHRWYCCPCCNGLLQGE